MGIANVTIEENSVVLREMSNAYKYTPSTVPNSDKAKMYIMFLYAKGLFEKTAGVSNQKKQNQPGIEIIKNAKEVI